MPAVSQRQASPVFTLRKAHGKFCAKCDFQNFVTIT